MQYIRKGTQRARANLNIHPDIRLRPHCVGYDADWPSLCCAARSKPSEVPGPPAVMQLDFRVHVDLVTSESRISDEL